MLDYIFLGFTGIIVGAMNAIAGGGMMIGFPAMLVAGLPPIVANATSYIAVIPGQIGSIYAFRKYFRKVPRAYILLIIPCAVGSAIGSHILSRTPSTRFEELLPILLLLAVILFAIQPYLHFHLNRHLKGRAKSSLPLFLIGAALLPMCVYGGYFGIGFGFVMLAFLGFTKLGDAHRINALKGVATLSVSLVASGTLLGSGLVDWRSGLFMAAGNGLGGYYGARLSQRFSSHAIRVAVIFIGIGAIMYLSLKYYSAAP